MPLGKTALGHILEICLQVILVTVPREVTGSLLKTSPPQFLKRFSVSNCFDAPAYLNFCSTLPQKFALLLYLPNTPLTIQQTAYWKEPITFYERTLKYAPNNRRFYNELAIEYENKGNNSEAEMAYKEALKINPAAVGIYYKLGNLYDKTGNREGSSAISLKTLGSIEMP